MNIKPLPAEYGPWNPGLESEVPREYLPLSTIFRSENVSTSIAKAHELSDYCGLPVHELVAFRADRLIVHELLIRVIVSLAVPDGRDYEDLGRNFREIAATILNRYIAPHRDGIGAGSRAGEKRRIPHDRAGARKGVRRSDAGRRGRWRNRLAPAARLWRTKTAAARSDGNCRGARPADYFRVAEKIYHSGHAAGRSLL